MLPQAAPARRHNGAHHPRVQLEALELDQVEDETPIDTSDGTGALFVDVGLVVAGVLGASALFIWALQGFPS